MGAADVILLIPISGISMEECFDVASGAKELIQSIDDQMTSAR
jgi:glutamate formiminotransferase